MKRRYEDHGHMPNRDGKRPHRGAHHAPNELYHPMSDSSPHLRHGFRNPYGLVSGQFQSDLSAFGPPMHPEGVGTNHIRFSQNGQPAEGQGRHTSRRPGLEASYRGHRGGISYPDHHAGRHQDHHAGRHQDHHAGRHQDHHAGRHQHHHAGRHQDHHTGRHQDHHTGRHQDHHTGRHQPGQPPVVDFRESRVGKYLSLSTTIQMDLPPCAWEESSKQSQLSTDMARFFLANRQDPEFFRKKIELWASLEDLVSKTFPGGFAQVFGSTLNGFGSSSSDMDMCIFLITNGVEDQSQLHRLEFIKQSLFRLRRVIKKDLGHRILPDIEMIPAKVPILKLHDGLSDVSIDISCNHPIGVRNTHLLYHYSQADWRVAPLVHILKAWAKAFGINEAKNGTLSSYSLTLLTIHVLQSAVRPPVLPSLQQKHDSQFLRDSDVSRLDFGPLSPTTRSENKQSLGELLVAFFQYYNETFDFARDAASVRTGAVLKVSDCQQFAHRNGTPKGQWNAYICVEEPYDRTNAGRAICRRESFDEILEALAQTWEQIKQKGEKVLLESILSC
eukprot:maker-scaffold959_size76551-snap-gene-0.17 protein:Tk01213 transcript:maker-scaffold959_size76551-snap-gene-0.17-mRNA-1 annotation:"poly rna polymerase gld-2 homolog a-like"